MATSTDTVRHFVATLIVLLLILRVATWAWRTYHQAQDVPQQQDDAVLQQKIAASHAYDNALLKANALLDRQDTSAARQLLDSLGQQPTEGLFQIELQKLRAARQRLDSL